MRKYLLIVFLIGLSIFMTSCKKEVNITLNINNEVKEIKIEKGAILGSTYDPNLEGYTFLGWYLDSSFNNSFDVNTQITEDLELYAKLINTVDVKIIIDSEESVIKVAKGIKVSELEKKEIAEKQFVGWYYDQEFTKFVPVNTVIEDSLTLYAKYIGAVYTLSFEENGGNEIKNVKFNSGSVPEEPSSNPSILGYDFSHWSLDKEGKEVYNFTEPVNHDFTLYANYVEADYEALLNSLVPDVIEEDIFLPIGKDSFEYNWDISDSSLLNQSGICNPDTIDREISVALTINVKGSDESMTFEKNTIIKKYELKELIDGNVVMGYTSSWYYNGYTIEELKTLDILYISFAYVLPDGTLNLNDISKLLVETVSAGHKYGVRVCLSIQGYGEDTKNFSDCAANETLRVKLVKSMVDAVVKYRLDGIDIDWEYPGSYSGRGLAEDRKNYTLLIKEIRSQLDKINSDYLLTAAIPGGPWGCDRFEMSTLANYFDYINMMSYDLNSGNSGTHHTALYPSTIISGTVKGCSVDETVKLWNSQGVPLNKIVLGIAFYGKDIKTRANSKDGIGQSAVTGASYQNSAYTKIINSYFSLIGQTVNYNFDYSSCAPYMYNTEKRLFFTYDNELSIINKCEYALSTGLGGVMIWEIGEDHTSTLITAVAQGMNRKLEDKPLIVGGTEELNVGDEFDIKVIKEVCDTMLNEQLIYTISDESIVELKGNTVKLLKSGTVTITATNKTTGAVYGVLTIIVK